MKKSLLTFLILILITSSFAQSWTKYGNGPVLRRDTILANLPHDLIGISDCWVNKEGSLYKMWYTCGGLNYPSDTLLRSRICYCESTDGINWIKYAGNPVLDVSYNGAWDSLGVETASVIVDSAAPASERYKMWYAGQYFNTYRYDFGYAVSPDGLNWTKHPNPILQVGSASSWEGGFIEGGSVIKDGPIYKMWYAGYSLINGHVNIGYATSPDGIVWTKDPGNPIFTTSTIGWDSVYVQDPHVIKLGNTYHMWYGGANTDTSYSQQTGYAYSTNGINWTKSPLNPIVTTGAPGSWDDVTASFPSVLLDNGVWKMWYTGKDSDPPPANSMNYYWEIGYATDSTFPSGITTYNENQSISIYPNPATDKLNIRFSGEQLNNPSAIIFNLLGEELIHVNMGNGINAIDISTLPAGIYFLHCTEGEFNEVLQKFIISR